MESKLHPSSPSKHSKLLELHENLEVEQATLESLPFDLNNDEIIEERLFRKAIIASLEDEIQRLTIMSDADNRSKSPSSESSYASASSSFPTATSKFASTSKKHKREGSFVEAPRDIKTRKLLAQDDASGHQSPSTYARGSHSADVKPSQEDLDREFALALDKELNPSAPPMNTFQKPSTVPQLSSAIPAFDGIDLSGIDDDLDINAIIAQLHQEPTVSKLKTEKTASPAKQPKIEDTVPHKCVQMNTQGVTPQIKAEPKSQSILLRIPVEQTRENNNVDPKIETLATIPKVKNEVKAEPGGPAQIQSWDDMSGEEGTSTHVLVKKDSSSSIDNNDNKSSPFLIEPQFGFGEEYDLDYMVKDERRQVQEMLKEIRPDETIPKEQRMSTPAALKLTLMEHQKEGLAWMLKQEQGGFKGGVLADDMGLGKTVQAMALIVANPSNDAKRKTTLIVAPVALLEQWRIEIAQKIKKDHTLKVYLHHGTKKRLKTFEKFSDFDVVLTSYGTLGAEFKKLHAWEVRNKDYPEARYSDAEFPFLGDKSQWYRVILDESQHIKNHDTFASKACTLLHATYRFCLSGTPIQNSAIEFFSILRYLRIRPYNNKKLFNQDIGRPLQAKQEYKRSAAMKRLQAIVQLCLLRRTKDSLIDGEPILQLPPKRIDIAHAVFSEDETQFYQSIETKAVLQFNKYLREGTALKNYSYILVMLLRLRQAACHPHLINDLERAAAAELTGENSETILALLAEFSEETIARIKDAGSAFECPICFDASENPKLIVKCGHELCSDCLVKVVAQHQQQAGARGDEHTHAKCPHCREPLNQEKVVDYAVFKQHFFPESVSDDVLGLPSSPKGYYDEILSSDESDDGDDDGGDLAGFIVDDDYVSEDEYKDKDEEDLQIVKEGSRSTIKNRLRDRKPFKPYRHVQNGSNESLPTEDDLFSELLSDTKAKDGLPKAKDRLSYGETKAESSQKGMGKSRQSDKPVTMAERRRKAMLTKKGKRKYFDRIAKMWMSSAKVDKCLEILANIKLQDPKLKTIIFSQFTSLLDLVEVPLFQNGYTYTRYDGSMSPNERNAAVLEFLNEENNISVMLVSLKAGNAGLNLVGASQVIIMDPFWNGYVEAQAIDRAHRIGQTREVCVHRLIVEGTVEDRILELQERKRQLVESALDENAGKNITRLGLHELGFLFGLNALGNQPAQPPMRRIAGADI